ncbi:hypothetical protein OKW38_005167 [Paraburkholderia sp. MM5496-R1]|uniref:hypothetical protein n=1 Tax=unclassified Paraburkholderia TaxID=2615204 RepID=UPI00160CD981|nr:MULTISPECIES: hypothetical protein [unclassified Paraburkholderia]MBB5413887.1 hypothetical protein [Paraburkholderia sp. HC6.4b]MBB5456324.1 hypothetical protein [Paraburkholderia sp. Kb1A]
MSSRNAKLRETLRMGVPPSPDEDGEEVIEWRPDWGKNCEACGQTPCMAGVSGGVVVIEATHCAECLDTDASAPLAIGSGY